MIVHFWGVAILAISLFFRIDTVIDARISKDFLFVSLVAISVLLFGIEKDKLKQNKLIIGSLIYLSLSTYFIQWRQDSQAVIYQWFCVNAGIILLAQFLCNFNKKDLRKLYNWLAVICLVQCSWVILERMFQFNVSSFMVNDLLGNRFCHINAGGIKAMNSFCYDNEKYQLLYDIFSGNMPASSFWGDLIQSINWYPSAISRGDGSLQNSNLSGALIAITAIFLFRKRFIWFVPVAILAIICTDSTTSMVTFLAAASVFSFYKLRIDKKTIAICSGLVFIAIAIYAYMAHDLATGNGRFEVWHKTLAYIAHGNYLVGYGVGFFSDNFGIMPGTKIAFKQAHNEYLEALMAYGAIGLSIILMLIIKALIKRKNIYLTCCIIAICVNSFSNFPFHVSTLAAIGCIIFGISLSGLSNNEILNPEILTNTSRGG